MKLALAKKLNLYLLCTYKHRSSLTLPETTKERLPTLGLFILGPLPYRCKIIVNSQMLLFIYN